MNNLTKATTGKSISVRDAISLPKMPNLRLVAGKDGLDKIIDNVSVYEVEDAYKWLQPNQFILSTLLAVPPNRYEDVFKELSKGKVSGIVLCYTEIYYGNFPQQLIELANQYSIPLFSASKDIAYVDIMLPLMQAIIDSESQQLHLRIEVMNEINKLLIQGATFTSFLSLIHKFISKPILLLDKDYEILALNASEDRARDYMMHFIKETLADFVKEIGRHKNPPKYIQYHYDNKHLNVFPIISNKQINGYLIVFNDYKNKSKEFTTVIEQCSEGLSILFVQYYSDIIHQNSTKIELLNIIEKKQLNPTDHKKLEQGLVALGLNFSHELRFAFLTFNNQPISNDDYSYEKRKYNKITELINLYFNYGICFEKDGIYMLLLPYIRSINFNRNLVNLLDNLTYSYDNFKCIISSPIKENNDFHYAYNLTLQMLKLKSRMIDLNQKILRAEDYEIFIHLYKIINTDNEAFLLNWAKKLLKPLSLSSKDKNKQLYENLKALLLNDVDVKVVASRLHVHKNTLQYRMNKIKELLGEDPFHTKRFEYTLAIYILMLNESNDNE